MHTFLIKNLYLKEKGASLHTTDLHRAISSLLRGLRRMTGTQLSCYSLQYNLINVLSNSFATTIRASALRAT